MGWVSTPVTIETTDSLYLAIHEANLTDYAAMNLKPVEQVEDNKTVTLRAALTPWSTGEKVRVTDTRVSPWRTMIVAESAGDLLLSRLMLNLNEPCRITDTSWIQPMRYIGIWWTYHMKHNTWHAGPHHGATTENTMRHIDLLLPITWEVYWWKGGMKTGLLGSLVSQNLIPILIYNVLLTMGVAKE